MEIPANLEVNRAVQLAIVHLNNVYVAEKDRAVFSHINIQVLRLPDFQRPIELPAQIVHQQPLHHHQHNHVLHRSHHHCTYAVFYPSHASQLSATYCW
jgi:hypothetical protein